MGILMVLPGRTAQRGSRPARLPAPLVVRGGLRCSAVIFGLVVP
ncbi:hypothetical protein QJS66_22910 [Kocuria rhizophila]|nr:hypothetical protein QJS66_22910 [Kocuria rhizophila]